MGYLSYNASKDDDKKAVGSGALLGGPGFATATYATSQLNKPFDEKIFGDNGPKGYGGPGSQYLSQYGFKETNIDTRAIDRYQDFYGRKDAYIQNTLATTGILDQARAVNAQAQARTEGAIWAGGQAQQQALREAEGYIDDQAAYGYQQAADMESRLLGETRSNLAGSGLWNSSMQGQAASYALERGMRARLAVNSEASQLYQRIALGKGAAAADTYTRLAGFYEGARQTNEQSLMYEFDWRVGRGNPPAQQSQGDNSGAAWASAAATVLSAIAVAW